MDRVPGIQDKLWESQQSESNKEQTTPFIPDCFSNGHNYRITKNRQNWLLIHLQSTY